jgi:hypothetical protein
MSRRQPQLEPKSGAREAVECIGFLVLGTGAVAAWSGKLTVDKLVGYGRSAEAAVSTFISVWLIPSLICLIMAVIAIAGLRLALIAARRGAFKGRFKGRTGWHYRRRWNAVMHRNDLTVETDDDRVLVPRLRSVRTGPDYDLVQVRMAHGQVPIDFHAKAERLAQEFGAAEMQVQMDRSAPLTNIALMFSHRPRPRPGQKVLQMPVRPHREPVQARTQQASIQIDWARIRFRDHQGNRLPGLWGLRVKWSGSWATAAI